MGRISAKGLCSECSVAAVESNVVQMVARSGPNFQRWREQMAACVGAIPLDVLRELEAQARD